MRYVLNLSTGYKDGSVIPDFVIMLCDSLVSLQSIVSNVSSMMSGCEMQSVQVNKASYVAAGVTVAVVKAAAGNCPVVKNVSCPLECYCSDACEPWNWALTVTSGTSVNVGVAAFLTVKPKLVLSFKVHCKMTAIA